MSQAEIESSKELAREILCMRLGRSGPPLLVVAPNLSVKDAQSALHEMLVMVSALAEDLDIDAQQNEAAPARAGALRFISEIACNLSEACGHV